MVVSRMLAQFGHRNLLRIVQMEDTDRDGDIKLKWMLGKLGMRIKFGRNWVAVISKGNTERPVSTAAI
jgi:hypothetical protein